MRLQAIKLTGFKSFVDATTVPFPNNLCAVVGPNGCGKSNIIDAVRWVMGEGSAKNLRGENMTDVIFNGSGTRKPNNAASIDLIFDNSDGRIGGEYAAYADIAIRREVSRDGQSNYLTAACSWTVAAKSSQMVSRRGKHSSRKVGPHLKYIHER